MRLSGYLQGLAVVRRITPVRATPDGLELELELTSGLSGFRRMVDKRRCAGRQRRRAADVPAALRHVLLDHVDNDDLAIFLRRLQWTLLALAACWLLWLLAPILTPFVFGAMLGWLGDPVVDRLRADAGRSRNTAVMLVFGAMSVLVLLALVVLVPLVEAQIVTLFESLPHYRDWFVGTALPWLERRTGPGTAGWLDPERLIELVRTHWEQAGGAAATMLGYLSRSGFALLGWIANIVLLPVLTFFFLRDWDLLVGRVAALVPRDHAETVSRLARESSAVLGAFLRGQLLVMLVLGVLYGIGLSAGRPRPRHPDRHHRRRC